MKPRALPGAKAVPSSPPCDCGLPAAYEACCGRFHAGPLQGLAPTPEALMRSRYSAFVRDLRPYLLQTWHPSTRPASVEPPEPGLKWLGLTVLQAPPPSPGQGRVTFVARYKIGGRAFRLAESSAFEVVEGRWHYLRAIEPGNSADPAEPA